jgi:class 3 adenylate cyclase
MTFSTPYFVAILSSVYAAIGTVSNVASRLCDEVKPWKILISSWVLTKVEDAVQVEPVGGFELRDKAATTMWSGQFC